MSNASMIPPKCWPLGQCLCTAPDSVATVARWLEALVAARQGGFTLAVNAEKVDRCQREPAFVAIMRASALPYPDGSGALLALRLLHGQKSIKIDMPRLILELAHRNHWRVAMIGARERVIRSAVSAVARLYPDADVVYYADGYQDEQEYRRALRQLRPDIAMLALGTPKQELFARGMAAEKLGTLFLGCGGAFDVLAGEVKRAPKWLQTIHMEWFYRLLKNPSRWRRQLALPRFLGWLIGAMFRKSS